MELMNMETLDLRKQYKNLYAPSAKNTSRGSGYTGVEICDDRRQDRRRTLAC